jgi:hypothetical protein
MSDDRRRRLENVIPEIIKRAVERGVEKAVEAPDNLKELVGGIKLPREVAGYVFSQIEETKNGLFRVVAKEVRDFLDQTNLGAEMQKMLTTVQFEINTTIRFKPNEGPANGAEAREPGADGGSATQGERPATPAPMPKAEVKADVRMRRYDRPNRRRNRE